jgi:hypothetical protein
MGEGQQYAKHSNAQNTPKSDQNLYGELVQTTQRKRLYFLPFKFDLRKGLYLIIN